MGLFTKDIKTMNDLFVHQLQDIYYAEKQLVKALPKMAEKATDKCRAVPRFDAMRVAQFVQLAVRRDQSGTEPGAVGAHGAARTYLGKRGVDSDGEVDTVQPTPDRTRNAKPIDGDDRSGIRFVKRHGFVRMFGGVHRECTVGVGSEQFLW